MKNLNSLIPTYPIKHSLYAQVAVDIGEYIKSNTNENDRIYVWGNMPVVYLYSERECVDFQYLFTYPVGVGIINSNYKVLLIHLKRNPPKYFTFFQYIDIVDSWNMEKVQSKINVPYKLEKMYPVRNQQKEYHPIPLYVRDDEIYLKMLLERFRISKDERYLQKILHIDSDNKVAKFWSTIIKENLNYDNSMSLLKNYQFTPTELVILDIDILKYFERNELLLQTLEELVIDEKNYRILQEKGEFYFSRGDSIEAFEMFNKAKELNGYSAELHNDMGVLAYTLEDYESAIFYLKKAIDIFPDYIDAKNNLNQIDKSYSKQ